MKYEIEIDEDMLKGYKPLAFRVPEQGENYISSGSQINSIVVHTQGEVNVPYLRLIVKNPREIKFRFCGYVKNNSVNAGKYYMYNGYLIHNSNYSNYVENGLEIWEKIDD